MTELIHMTGDIRDSTAPAVGHGVNTEGVMGAGIAVLFRDEWPDMYEEYKRLCADGSLQPGGLFVYEFTDPGDNDYTIYNLASQDKRGRNARYEWLAAAVDGMMEHALFNGIYRIALPRIGSGIGGLDQDKVEEILKQRAEAGPVDIELWTYET